MTSDIQNKMFFHGHLVNQKLIYTFLSHRSANNDCRTGWLR